MAFSELELKRIDKEVGGLCQKRSPTHIRVEYRVKGHEVLIYSRRPQWGNPKEWGESGTAKLKYVRSSNEWRLYWQRANGKWVSYSPCPYNKNLRILVEEIDKDFYGCFFG